MMLIEDYINTLKDQHKQIDSQINDLSYQQHNYEFEIRRLKKIKLKLKDQIEQLERSLTPDIPA
ncbi:DUF465 domain-containing protein [Ferrovum sp. PN-J185]|uniref:DUF465 domain-containing protein n=1 Tax=Ferrovum sp. PN-J185 TaxID=1356306 RepID=UPI0009ECF30A|nr:DUF465 domain-containing protein [Ferrovum sp. PN-J185]MCC6069096.1 DUF465 domain-containing protein [Ferrovum sp. PN-J185]MDE1890923.1 DUF465 domain-containing protein [Betaproteobacteria bacterium]MDE2055765.1 DUF465 domain-containing protein [Betaproteobacteria bacterium]